MPNFRYCLSLAAATALLLSGCKHSQQNASQAGGNAAQPATQSTLAIAGRMLDGADQATIRSYLQTVQEVKPKKFSVKWSPDTIPVSREEAMRSLQKINEDGSIYSFASSEPVVGRLAPGRILWIYDVAIRRIDSVDKFGDLTLVHTLPVAMNEALPEADIEFESQANLGTAYGGLMAHAPKEPALQKTSSLTQHPYFRLVAQQPQGAEEPVKPPPEDDDPVIAATEDGYNGKRLGFEYSLQYKVLPSRISFEMEARKEEEGGGAGESNEINRDQRGEYMQLLKERHEDLRQASMSYARIMQLDQAIDAANRQLASEEGGSVAGNPPQVGPHAPGPNASPQATRLYNSIMQYNEEKEKVYKDYEIRARAAEDLEARMKKLASAGALAKKVFYIISDNLDVRFRSKMDLDRAAFSGNIKTAGGALKQFGAHFSDMKGNIELEFIGRLGQPGNGAISVPVLNIPAVLNVPVPVGGIPFVLQFGGDFMVKLFLAGNHATQHFVTHFQFGGGAGLDSTTKGTDSEGKLSSSEPQIQEKTAMSPGTSGLVLAIQLPRVGLGLGLIGTNAMVYTDFVHVLTMTNSAAVATLNPPCQRFTLDTIGSVGLDLNLVPVPIPMTVATKAMSQRKEVWRRSPPWKYINPDIPMCRLSGD